MAETAPMDPFFERALIGRTEQEKAEARRRRAEELTKAAEKLAEIDQDQGE